MASLELEEEHQPINCKAVVEVDSVTSWEQSHAVLEGFKNVMYQNKRWGLNMIVRIVKELIKVCSVCQKNRMCVRNTTLQTLNDSEYPGQVVGMDFAGPINQNIS